MRTCGLLHSGREWDGRHRKPCLWGVMQTRGSNESWSSVTRCRNTQRAYKQMRKYSPSGITSWLIVEWALTDWKYLVEVWLKAESEVLNKNSLLVKLQYASCCFLLSVLEPLLTLLEFTLISQDVDTRIYYSSLDSPFGV